MRTIRIFSRVTAFSSSNDESRKDRPRSSEALARLRFDKPTLESLFGKPPPQAPEAEMALLGAMILDPRTIGDVIMVIKTPTAFYQEAHGTIYQALVTLYDRHQSGDLVQLLDALRDKDVIQQVGGVKYLEKLATETPGSAGAIHWARIVSEKSKLRSLIETAGNIIHSAYTLGQGDDENTAEIIDKAEQQIFEIARKHEMFEPQAMAELIQAEYDRLEALQGQGVSGVSTGYFELDKMTCGLQPGEMVIVAARPSMGKCLAHDSEILLTDGSLVTIEDLYRRREGELLTLKNDWKVGPARPSDFVDDGIKPAFRVTTRLGRTIETTLPHPFLTIDGWRPLGELSPGDRIAVPRELPVFGDQPMRECEIKLLGYLIGDGGLTGANPRFTNSNPRIQEDFLQAVGEFGGVEAVVSSTRSWETPSWRVSANREERELHRTSFAGGIETAVGAATITARDLAHQIGVSPASVSNWRAGKTVPSGETLDSLCEVLEIDPDQLAPAGVASVRKNSRNRLSLWLSELGLMSCGAHSKCIPAPVFRLPRPQLALFLNRLFATDGWATLLASGQAQLGYGTVSERLGQQVQHLLLRFGVIASLRRRSVKYKETRREAWQLDITDSRCIQRFAEHIGIFGKEAALSEAVTAVHRKRYQSNRDLIPTGIWRRIESAKGEESWRSVASRMGRGEGANLHPSRRSPTRDTLADIAGVLDDAELKQIAESDVYWDAIVSIEAVGNKQVYDLTIPDTHNFIARDICVHNTALAMNLAEQIALGGAPFAGADHHGPKVPVGFFSLEMSKSAIAQRLLSARSGISSHDMRSGNLKPGDIDRLLAACGELHEAPIYIDDMPAMTVMALRARARRMVQQYGIKAIFIDYLQLMTAPAFARESRQVEVAAISRGIKALARELSMPVVCLSQLNRGPESRSDNKPRMSDLRESGSIEQDADVVILLHREEYYHVGDPSWANDPDNADKQGVAELIIAKQRNGPTGVVELMWDAETTRFKNLARSRGGGYADGGGYTAPAPTGSSSRGYGGGRGGPADTGYAAAPNPGGEQAPFDTPPARVGFSPGKKAGPVADFRDGGGPDLSSDPDEEGGIPI